MRPAGPHGVPVSVLLRFECWAKAGRLDAILAPLRDPGSDLLILVPAAVRANLLAIGAENAGRHRRPGRSGAGPHPGRGPDQGARRLRRAGAPVASFLTAAQGSDIARAELPLAGTRPGRSPRTGG
jgi:hypothetical protein